MAGVKRTVVVADLSYVDADGNGQVGHRGDEVLVHPDDVQHFDWLQENTPEMRHLREREAVEAAEKPKPVSKAKVAVEPAE